MKCAEVYISCSSDFIFILGGKLSASIRNYSDVFL